MKFAFISAVLSASFSLFVTAATFPQLALGGEPLTYECVVIVTNESEVPWDGSLRAFKGNHEPWPVGWYHNNVIFGARPELNLYLPARATRKIGIYGNTGSLAAGYLIIEPDEGYDEEKVAISYFYNVVRNLQSLADSVSIPAGQLASEFWIPVEYTRKINTGFAWAGMESPPEYEVILELFDKDGARVGEVARTFEGHLAQFFTEIFENIPEGFVGSLHIATTVPLIVTALRLELTETGFQLTGTPPHSPRISDRQGAT